MLPSFYRAIADYLPATYLGNGILKATSGDVSPGGKLGILRRMAVIFNIISGLELFKKNCGKMIKNTVT